MAAGLDALDERLGVQMVGGVHRQHIRLLAFEHLVQARIAALDPELALRSLQPLGPEIADRDDLRALRLPIPAHKGAAISAETDDGDLETRHDPLLLCLTRIKPTQER